MELNLVWCVFTNVLRLSNGSQVIDVDGLRMFVKELESLPCTLPRPCTTECTTWYCDVWNGRRGGGGQEGAGGGAL